MFLFIFFFLNNKNICKKLRHLTNTTLFPNRFWWAQASSVPACASVGVSRRRGVIPGAGARGGADGYGAAAADARGPVRPRQGVSERGADCGQAAGDGAGWRFSADPPQTSYPPFRRYKLSLFSISRLLFNLLLLSSPRRHYPPCEELFPPLTVLLLFPQPFSPMWISVYFYLFLLPISSLNMCVCKRESVLCL